MICCFGGTVGHSHVALLFGARSRPGLPKHLTSVAPGPPVRQEIRKTKGITARAVADEEIVERLFFTMINEGFKILEVRDERSL